MSNLFFYVVHFIFLLCFIFYLSFILVRLMFFFIVHLQSMNPLSDPSRDHKASDHLFDKYMTDRRMDGTIDERTDERTILKRCENASKK